MELRNIQRFIAQELASKLRKKLTEAEKVAREASTSAGTLETEKEELEMKIKQLESEKREMEKEKADLEVEKQVLIHYYYCLRRNHSGTSGGRLYKSLCSCFAFLIG